jgi:response regulator RpfG family c-di-GMP phosphodiesterase
MRIMLVDDEFNNLQALRRILNREKIYQIEAFTSPLQALDRIHQAVFDLIISDYRMPQMDGVSFLGRSKEIQPAAQRIMVTAYCDKDSLYGAINRANVQRYIEKPYYPEVVLQVIKEVLADRIEQLRMAHLVFPPPPRH